MRRTLINLLSNASEAMAGKGGELGTAATATPRGSPPPRAFMMATSKSSLPTDDFGDRRAATGKGVRPRSDLDAVAFGKALQLGADIAAACGEQLVEAGRDAGGAERPDHGFGRPDRGR